MTVSFHVRRYYSCDHRLNRIDYNGSSPPIFTCFIVDCENVCVCEEILSWKACALINSFTVGLLYSFNFILRSCSSRIFLLEFERILVSFTTQYLLDIVIWKVDPFVFRNSVRNQRLFTINSFRLGMVVYFHPLHLLPSLIQQ